MKKSIESLYDEEKAIRFAYECGNENDGVREEARQRMKALRESLSAEGQDFANVYRLYKDAKDRGNELIDISEVVWDDKVPALIESFREHGIERFAFSSTYSGTVQTAWLFTQNGCRLEGMTEINSPHADCLTEERERIPTYIFTVG